MDLQDLKVLELERQLRSLQQLVFSEQIRHDQEIKQMKLTIQTLELAVLSLAFGHYELQDQMALQLWYPKSIRQIKRSLKEQFIPLRTIHPTVLANQTKPVRNNLQDVITTSITMQQQKLEDYLENGFQTQANLIYNHYEARKKNSFFQKNKNKFLQVGGSIVGVALSLVALLIQAFRYPENILKLLLLEYSRTDIKNYIINQFPMLFCEQSYKNITNINQQLLDQIQHTFNDDPKEPGVSTTATVRRLSRKDLVYRLIVVLVACLLLLRFLVK